MKGPMPLIARVLWGVGAMTCGFLGGAALKPTGDTITFLCAPVCLAVVVGLGKLAAP